MLILVRELGERIVIGEDVVVSILDVRPNWVRLGIEAPPNVEVDREEVRLSKNAHRRRKGLARDAVGAAEAPAVDRAEPSDSAEESLPAIRGRCARQHF